ncbi:hypothetical protein ANO14919_030680 [Xylariales sp. No.14919]|nr:hypothetical protein ANO14919_030680 [Xylariales sp. No.14919]
MNLIYCNAVITLINAASESRKHGLPGISTVPRYQQLQETFKHTCFVQCFPDISHMVKASPWCTRGWTFQEGFFAPRRIVFTDYGVSYLCHGMHCMEWKQHPLDQITPKSLLPLEGIIPMAANVNTKTYKLEVNWRSASDWIPEYSKRNFTYSSDALDACRGILNYFRGVEEPVYSVWGTPISCVDPTSYIFELRWRHEALATRNVNFPSWSFLGWHGAVSPEATRIASKSLYLGHYQEPFLEPKDIERVLGDRRSLREENDSRLRYLHFKTKVIYLSLVYNDWTTQQKKHRTCVRYLTLGGLKSEYFDLIPAGYHASLRLASNLYMLTYVYYDRETLGCSGKIGIRLDPEYMGDVGPAWIFFGIDLLILEDQGGLYERVGVTKFSLRGDANVCVAFTDAAGELLDYVDLVTILPYFLIEGEECTVVIS